MTRLKALAKSAVDGVSLLIIAPAAATCWIESALATNAEAVFSFWGQCLAVVPGPPGIVLRRAFYRLTLEACSKSFFVGFGALFTHRYSVVEEGVYVGAYALVGSARLGRGCLIGSRASLLSGPHLHQLDEEGRWMPADFSQRQQIHIGAHAWVGEGAIVMVDVGAGAMVAAGSVVSTPVPAGVVVAGNPSRFVRRLGSSDAEKTPMEPSVR